MPRDYQAKKNNPYRMPRSLYRRVLALIRDYDRMRAEVEELILASPNPEGIKGGGPGDPTARAAERIEKIQTDIRAIDVALRMMPAEYCAGVFDAIRYYKKFPIDADRSTYARHKQRFVWDVAHNLGLVDQVATPGKKTVL